MNILDQHGAHLANLRADISDLTHEVKLLQSALEGISKLHTQSASTIAIDALTSSLLRERERAEKQFTR